MRTYLSRGFLVSCLACALVACSNNNTTLPTTPTPTTKTDTFTGSLTTNGAVSHSFTAAGSGSMTAALTTLTTATTGLTVSLAIGTWNGAVCQVVLANDLATQGTIVTGTVSAASNLCVRISDATGIVPGPTPYVITVVHP